MVATPNVCGLFFTSINPILRKILLRASPCGKTEALSLKYLYATLSFENILPITGKIPLAYMEYPCLNGNFVGTDVSKITKMPPFFKTRKISDNPFSKFSKFRIPKETVIASNELSSKGNASESPLTNSTVFSILPFFGQQKASLPKGLNQ